jgi:hypothetical protein
MPNGQPDDPFAPGTRALLPPPPPFNPDAQHPPPQQPPAQQPPQAPPVPGRVTKVTTQTEMPANEAAAMLSGQPPRAPQRFHRTMESGASYWLPYRSLGLEEWLNKCWQHPDYARHVFYVRRIKPREFAEEVILPSERIPLSPLDDLMRDVLEEFGGGTYSVEVTEPGGGRAISGLVPFDEKQYPPKRRNPVTSTAGLFAGPAEDPDIAEKKKQNALKKLDQESARLEAELERARRDAGKGDDEMNAGVKQELAELKREAAESRKDTLNMFEKLSTSMMTMFKETISGLKDALTQKSSGGDDKGMVMFVEAIKAGSAAQAEALKEAARQQAEGAKATAAMNENIVKMTIEANKGQGAQADKLFAMMTAMFEKRASENPMKELLSVKKEAKEEVMDMIEFVNNRLNSGGGGGLADVEGPLGAWGPVVAQVVPHILSFLKSRQQAPGIDAALGFPLSGMNDAQLAEVATKLAPMLAEWQKRQGPQRARPFASQPAGQLTGGPPASGPQAAAPAFSIEEEDDEEERDALDVPSAVPAAPPPPAHPPRPTPAQVLAQLGPDRYKTETSIGLAQMILKDIQQNSPEPRWIGAALVWLHPEIKQKLAAVADATGCIAVLKVPGSERAWEALVPAMQANSGSYQTIMRGMQIMLEEIRKTLTPAPAAPVAPPMAPAPVPVPAAPAATPPPAAPAQ